MKFEIPKADFLSFSEDLDVKAIKVLSETGFDLGEFALLIIALGIVSSTAFIARRKYNI